MSGLRSTVGDDGRRKYAFPTDVCEVIGAVLDAWRVNEHRDAIGSLGLIAVSSLIEDAVVAVRAYDLTAEADRVRRDEIEQLAREFIAKARGVHARHGYDGPVADARVDLAVHEAVRSAEQVRPAPLVGTIDRSGIDGRDQ